MLHFQDQPWMLRHGVSHISALISPDVTEPKDIFWQINLWYVNGAACWRRVPWPRRPNVLLGLHGFCLAARSWRSIEHLNFWNLSDDDWFDTEGAGVDAQFSLDGLHKTTSDLRSGDSSWRIVQREGPIFTVEISVLPEGKGPPPPAISEQILVTADGTEEATTAKPEDDYLRTEAMLYVVEDVPFGVITVQVPRNVRDPEAYAIARARQLMLAPEHPEYIDIRDHAPHLKEFRNIAGDIYVSLHYHGYHGE